MGLQRMLRANAPALLDDLRGWVRNGSWLEVRAALAALAEPDLIANPKLARFALELHDVALERLAAVPATARRSEGFVAFRKGMGYTWSVVVAGLPEEGFAAMRRWAKEAPGTGDRDVRWVLKENLKKGRLSRRYGEQVAELLSQLG